MLDNYRDLIDELLGTPALVRAALAGGNPGAARVVATLHARDQLVLERVQRIKSQRDPHLKPLPSPATTFVEAENAEDLGGRFEIGRGDLVSLLMNLTLRDWERTATTDAEGIITLADEVEAHVEFDEAQRAQLEALAS